MQRVVGQNTHQHSCILQKASTHASDQGLAWPTSIDILSVGMYYHFLHTKQYGSAGTGRQKKSLVQSGAVWVAAGTITQKSEKINTALKCNVSHRADREMSTKISNVLFSLCCLRTFLSVFFLLSFISLSVLNQARGRRALFTIGSVSQRLEDNDQNGNVYTDFVAIRRLYIIEQCI